MATRPARCKLNREGTTIVQVTHSEKIAGYSDRVVRVHDGWIDTMRDGVSGR